MGLSESEVLALDRILVKNSSNVSGVQIERGYMGLGGSNTSGFSADSDQTVVYTADQLSDHPLITVDGDVICALENDVLYLKYKRDGVYRVFTLSREKPSTTSHGREIAYDTVEAARISLNFK